MQMTKQGNIGLLVKPIKGRTVLKWGIIFVVVFAVVLSALYALIFYNIKPPKETNLIANFHVHRAAYERLRDMLLADQNVRAVYVEFGVKTVSSGLPHEPSEVNFPVSRYNEYVTLLEQIGSDAAFRNEGTKNQLICIGAWGAGWAGDTRHIWVCWTDSAPNNQVTNLDDYYRNSRKPNNVFKHIDGEWYLRAD